MNRKLSALLLALCTPASAQLVNGDFETGTFAPWTVTPTPTGGTLFSSIITYDIDGPGPLAPSNAARFMVGRNAAGNDPAGIALTQSVSFPGGGTRYRLELDWSTHCVINAYNQTAGIFELLFDGNVIAQATAPITVQGQASYGHLSGEFEAPWLAVHTIGVRVTRPTVLGEEVFQYIDNITLTAIDCYANCDRSTGSPLLTANDFQCFLNKYVARDPYADCDRSMGVPMHTPNDFQCFLNMYAAGCP